MEVSVLAYSRMARTTTLNLIYNLYVVQRTQTTS